MAIYYWPSPLGEREGAEALGVRREAEDPAGNQRVMEEVCERENRRKALKRVRANQGSPGIDGMTVDELPGYLEQHWPTIREQLMSGTFEPKPVKREEIPKPDGGVRKLGIPTVSANCTRAQFAFGMGGDPPSVPSASRPALPGFEGSPNRRY
jgi:hypothetical protein